MGNEEVMENDWPEVFLLCEMKEEISSFQSFLKCQYCVELKINLSLDLTGSCMYRA